MEAGVRLWEEPPHAGGVVGIGLPVRGEQVDFLDGADLHADSCVDTAGPAKVTGLGVGKASPVKMGSRTNAKGPAVDRSVWSVGSTPDAPGGAHGELRRVAAHDACCRLYDWRGAQGR